MLIDHGGDHERGARLCHSNGNARQARKGWRSTAAERGALRRRRRDRAPVFADQARLGRRVGGEGPSARGEPSAVSAGSPATPAALPPMSVRWRRRQRSMSCPQGTDPPLALLKTRPGNAAPGLCRAGDQLR